MVCVGIDVAVCVNSILESELVAIFPMDPLQPQRAISNTVERNFAAFIVVIVLLRTAQRIAFPAPSRGPWRSRPARKMIRHVKLLGMCARPPGSPQRKVHYPGDRPGRFVSPFLT